jgi:hypothetical protein
MDDDELLNQLGIAEPCPMDWDRMPGDDRMRYCDSCGKHVYNLSAMTSAEAYALFRSQGADLCGRMCRSADGFLVTLDYPLAPAPVPAPTPWQFTIRSLMAVIAGVAALLGFTRLLVSSEDLRQPTANKGPMFMGRLRVLHPVPTNSNPPPCQPE